MATQIEIPTTDPQIEPYGDLLEGDSGHFFSEQDQSGTASVHEAGQPVAERSLTKSRKFGRLLLKPFSGRSSAVVQPVAADEQDSEHLRISEAAVDETRYKEIAESPLLLELPEGERAEAVSQTFELYKTAKEVVAPVIVGFADYLLEEARDRQIIFAARDGLGAYTAATQLKEKFDYSNPDPDQLVYAYLTRKVVGSTPPNQIGRYLEQLGVQDTKAPLLLADIGMYGTMVRSFKDIMPSVDVRYLISKTPEIPGYADGTESHMASVRNVVGNPAIHFMEDTFSGAMPSPARLIDQDGRLVPNTLNDAFPPAEALKREFAMKAIYDHAASLEERPKQPPVEAIKKLDDFLAQPLRFKHLMVPHNR